MDKFATLDDINYNADRSDREYVADHLGLTLTEDGDFDLPRTDPRWRQDVVLTYPEHMSGRFIADATSIRWAESA